MIETTIVIMIAMLAFRTRKTRQKLQDKSIVLKITTYFLAGVVTVFLVAVGVYLLSLVFGFGFNLENALYIYTVILLIGELLERALAWKKRRDIVALARKMIAEKDARCL